MGEQRCGAALWKPERMHAPLWVDVSDRLDGLSLLPLTSAGRYFKQIYLEASASIPRPHRHPHESVSSSAF